MRFDILGVRVTVSYWAVALLTLAVVTSYRGGVLIPVCLGCSFIHELGHLAVIYRYRGKPASISVMPGEVSIDCDLSGLTVAQDAIVTIAGVLVNFITAVVFCMLNLLFTFPLFSDISLCSVCIGVFNLLPVRTLDGGQLLYLLLSVRLSRKATDVILNILTALFIIPIGIIGFVVLFASKYNYSLLFIAIYLISVIITKEMR